MHIVHEMNSWKQQNITHDVRAVHRASKLTDFPAGGCAAVAVFASAAAGPLAAERRFPLAIAQRLTQRLKQTALENANAEMPTSGHVSDQIEISTYSYTSTIARCMGPALSGVWPYTATLSLHRPQATGHTHATSCVPTKKQRSTKRTMQRRASLPLLAVLAIGCAAHSTVARTPHVPHLHGNQRGTSTSGTAASGRASDEYTPRALGPAATRVGAPAPRNVIVQGRQFVLRVSGAPVVMVGPNVVVKGHPYLPAVDGDTPCNDVINDACTRLGNCTSCYTFNQADVDHIKSQGWNAIRLGVVWAGAQPRDEDALDPAFLSRLDALLNLTDCNGIHVRAHVPLV
jgi:hypothetical protein